MRKSEGKGEGGGKVVYKDFVFYLREEVAGSQIQIDISSDAMSLENLTNASVEQIGKQVSFETDYSKVGGDVTNVRLKIHPNDIGKNIFEMLFSVARGVVECEEYKRIQEEIGVYGRYLGEVGVGDIKLSKDVGEYLERAYKFAENSWGITREDICSSRKTRDVARVRHAIFYALRNRFSNGNGYGGKLGLSSCDIAKIMNRSNHATVLLGCKRVKEVLEKKKKKVKDFNSVEETLEEIVDVLGGIELNHNNT